MHAAQLPGGTASCSNKRWLLSIFLHACTKRGAAGSVASCRPAELVAKFMDNELRSGKDKKSDDQLEATLDKALMLFRYISVRRSSCCAPTAQDLLLCPGIRLSLFPASQL